MAQSPIKVTDLTKERIRVAAGTAGITQAEFVDRAVNEYIERHSDELFEGLRRAREVLQSGRNASVAYVLGVDEGRIDQIAGT